MNDSPLRRWEVKLFVSQKSLVPMASLSVPVEGTGGEGVWPREMGSLSTMTVPTSEGGCENYSTEAMESFEEDA